MFTKVKTFNVNTKLFNKKEVGAGCIESTSKCKIMNKL